MIALAYVMKRWTQTYSNNIRHRYDTVLSKIKKKKMFITKK